MIVRVILVGVLGVMIVVLIGHDEVLVIYEAIFVVIFCNWRCTLYRNLSATPRSNMRKQIPTTNTNLDLTRSIKRNTF